MADSALIRWWQYFEGRLLIGQSILLLAFASWTGWIYYSAFYKYVPAAGEEWRCATGETVALFFALLMTMYLLLLWLWQFGLVKRRKEQKPVSAWGLISFTAALLPVALLINTFWKS